MSLPNEHQQFIINHAVSQATNSNVYISGVEDLILKEIRDEKKGKLMLDTLIKKVGE
jgi:hypothetical protein